jgi:IstB-like ATP binding protein
MKDADEIELTLEKLKWLRLPGMARTLRELLGKAAVENLTSYEVLGRLCDEEKSSRMRSSIAAKVKGARFPEVNTIDAFDLDFDPIRKKLKSRYLGLHDVTFIDKGINPLFHRHARHWQNISRTRVGVARLPGQPPRRLRQRRQNAERPSRRGTAWRPRARSASLREGRVAVHRRFRSPGHGRCASEARVSGHQ